MACIYKDDTEVDIDLSDVVIRTTKDSGPGGQHRNKTESCVVMTDKKTGLTVKSAKKSQHQNREIAKTTLIERIRTQQLTEEHNLVSQERKEQVGSGMRGDKVRTYRTQDNQCINHLNNNKVRLTDIQKGKLDKLW